MSKGDLELNLDELESFAKDLISKQEKSEPDLEETTDLLQRIAALEINESKSDSDDSDSESDSSDSSDSDESGSSDSNESSNNDSGLDEGTCEGKT